MYFHCHCEGLASFVAECLVAVGASRAEASEVSDVLVAADLKGISSHGVARLFRYVEGIETGAIAANAETVVVQESAATAVLDAQNGLGQPASIRAMRLAMNKASCVGAGVVAVRNSNHFGIAGYYASLAVDRGMVGIAMTNASPQVCATFGAEPVFGTNPVAVGVPGVGGDDFLLDMATSVVPRGKLERMALSGETIPEGWAIDPAGSMATEHAALIAGLKNRDGYAILPLGGAGERFGGHKGFGLGLGVDLLCGPLAGAAWGRHVYGPEGARLGHLFVAIDTAAFGDPETIRAQVASLIGETRGTRRVHGASRIYTAGEKERAHERESRQNGIRLQNKIAQSLRSLAGRLGVPFPTTMRGECRDLP